MKFAATTFAIASLLAASKAQDASSNYTTGLLAALQGANLTTLAAVLQGYPQLAGALQQGNFSVFAPSNDALATLMSSANSTGTLNDTQIQNILMYHITPAMVMQDMLGVGMNHTIVPSLLTEPLLGANQTAPLVISIGADGSPRIRTAAQNVTIGANTTYQNLLIHVVDQVIDPPMNLTATVAAAGLTGISGALGAVASVLPVTALEMTPRITVFAPSNAAFANISTTIASLNESTIATVLANHVINGTVVYSTDITANTTAVSAAGETFTFSIENGTVYVMSGSMARARIIRTDIPTTNGVVHVIDQVLANTMSDPQAAASAASVAATAAPAATAGVAGAAASKTGAGYKTIAGASSLVALVAAAGFALLA